MRIVLPAIALLGLAALTLSGEAAGDPPAATAAHSVPAAAPATVPDELRVPDGQVLVLVAHVDQGSQVYTCTSGAWTLLEPAAVLDSATTQVLHTAGPKWVSTADGSAVTGSAVASVPNPGAVPQLLLKSTSNRGTGTFAAVDYIQRLRTTGGVAPAGTCTDGALQAVAYSAEYRFYAPA